MALRACETTFEYYATPKRLSKEPKISQIDTTGPAVAVRNNAPQEKVRNRTIKELNNITIWSRLNEHGLGALAWLSAAGGLARKDD